MGRECRSKGLTTRLATEGGGTAFLLSRVYPLSVQFVIWQHLKSYAAAPSGGEANQFDFYVCVCVYKPQARQVGLYLRS